MTRHAASVATVGSAMVFVAASLLGGCAKFNGDKAAFCAQLPSAPSFTTLAGTVITASPAKAAASLDAAAVQYRLLERTAPRSIRTDVSALGDSAERIAAELRSPDHRRGYRSRHNARRALEQQLASTTTVPGVAPGALPSTGGVPYNPDYGPFNAEYQIFVAEFSNHPGTVRAASSLTNYAVKDCGIASMSDPLAMFANAQRDGGVGGFLPGGSEGTTPTVQIDPPTSEAHDVAPSSTVP